MQYFETINLEGSGTLIVWSFKHNIDLKNTSSEPSHIPVNPSFASRPVVFSLGIAIPRGVLNHFWRGRE